MPIDKLSNICIEGYKSIRKASVELGPINILIGPNGAGKSNFISVFSLIQKILNNDLQITVSKCGSTSMLYNGPKVTSQLKIEASFGYNGYGFVLEPTDEGHMVFVEEYFNWDPVGNFKLGSGHFESKWEEGLHNNIDRYVKPVLRAKSWRVYHFHDTSRLSAMKQAHDVNNNEFLQQDAGNIAAFLLRLKNDYPLNYKNIVSIIQRVAPFFDDFVLTPNEKNDQIVLRWRKRGYDGVMNPNQLSDGTIRFICLTTLLMQPNELRPATIILDEPELGLFPQAMIYLAEMVKAVSRDGQIIISTQSADLVDEFSCEDIIIVEDGGDGTVFKRLDEESLEEWLEDDYTLGALWKKNLLTGDRR